MLDDEEKILEFSKEIQFIRPIKDTKEKIEKKLYSYFLIFLFLLDKFLIISFYQS